jgi:hypothetical protein
MARDGLRVCVCAGLLVGALLCLAAAPGEDRESILRTQLAVQNALQQGLDNLQRGNYQAAVFVLEAQVPYINGNRAYLNALRDAYRGYIQELRQANRTAEVPTYLRRLQILDPGSHLEYSAPGVRAREASAAPVVARPDPPAARPPAAPPPSLPAPVARGQGPDDPFAWSNSQEARALIDRAEQEFKSNNFHAARRLYEQVRGLNPAALADCRDHWAYCRLFAVVERANALPPGEAAPPDLEEEVRQVLALSLPAGLDAYGRKLLRELRQRPAAEERVEVRHTPAQAGGWPVAETANFCVIHRQSRAVAERVARIAEGTRTAMTRKWFGADPAPWNPRCNIYLYATAEEYHQATGAPAMHPGHSKMEFDGDRIVTRKIYLHGDDPNAFESILPHETTHVVLAGRFGKDNKGNLHQIPRWADEGMAVLTEPQARIDLHLHNLPKHRRDRELFSLLQLMKMNDYPHPRYIGPFYAQSVSLVDFLSKQPGGPRVFTQFLRDGLNGGYEPALRRHYNIQGFDELERRWLRHAFDTASPAPVAQKTP